MNEDMMKDLINANQVAIKEMGKQVMRHQEKIERMWKQIETVEARQLRDIKDQWQMIHDLSNLVNELKTLCMK